MTLKYLGGTLPNVGAYALTLGTLSRVPTGRWELNASTVASVDLVHMGKEYDYASGGAGMVAGGMVAGPVGALVGGLLPKAFKSDVVQFRILFRDGNVAHFAGSKGDYQRALKASYKGMTPTPATMDSDVGFHESRQEVVSEYVPSSGVSHPSSEEATEDMMMSRPVTEPHQEEGPRAWLLGDAECVQIPAPPGESKSDRRKREAQNDALWKEYKALLAGVLQEQKKAVHEQKLPMREALRLLAELEMEFKVRTRR